MLLINNNGNFKKDTINLITKVKKAQEVIIINKKNSAGVGIEAHACVLILQCVDRVRFSFNAKNKLPQNSKIEETHDTSRHMKVNVTCTDL